MTRLLFTAILMLTSFISLASQPIAIKTQKPLVSTQSEILYAFDNELKKLAIVDVKHQTSYELSMPKDAIGFDYATSANHSTPQAWVLTPEGVFSSHKKHYTPLISTSSLFTHLKMRNFNKVEFVLDANNDGLSDIMLPGISDATLYIQSKTGQFTPHTFAKQSDLSGYFKGNQLEVEIELNPKPQVIDLNQDGMLDLLFHTRYQAQVLYATKEGYGAELTPLQLPVKLGQLEDGGKRRIYALKDINNDGFVDLITRQAPRTKGMDAIKVETSYALYPGKAMGQFHLEKSFLPATNGTGQLRFDYDFDGDGKMELQRFEADFGFTTIAAMALSGGSTDIDIDVGFYRQSNEYYPAEPTLEREVEMEINMNGNDRIMSFFIGDVNGDGKHDIVLRNSRKTLSIYHGQEDTLLSKKRTKIKHRLPKNSNDILLVDINADGKDDFVLKFTDDEGNSTVQTLIN
ncbi:hypothetical protein PCIT_b0045 [Pseudoalteromonas citrea]|uniref:VCBS repeat-containing protein n=2 Tax=Pseudoalteromonas citrea TaxID=43655 RepID=A0AAD4FPM2_9GAMM|nr:VCBS repeat-containing protein [Pseudoalteromonas citrea]KAF7764132.1 hypothetical protein PCIT_b0045 [Pseudoalteromonas citrea]